MPQVLGKYNATEQVYIRKEELQQALSNEDEFPKRYAKRLFGVNISLDEVFDMLDRDGNGKIQFDELVYFIERTGVAIADRYFGYKWREVKDIWSFIYTLYTAQVLNMTNNSFLAQDIERSVGINTGYIQTTDFDIEHEEFEFLKKQGQRYTEAFLTHYVVTNGLQKKTDTDVVTATTDGHVTTAEGHVTTADGHVTSATDNVTNDYAADVYAAETEQGPSL